MTLHPLLAGEALDAPKSQYGRHGPGGPLFVTAVLLMVLGGVALAAAMSPSLHGEIHWFGGAVFLSCLPPACWRLATSLRSNPQWMALTGHIHRFSVLGVLTAGAFGASKLAPGLPQGLLERFALGAEAVLLVVLAMAIARVERQSR